MMIKRFNNIGLQFIIKDQHTQTEVSLGNKTMVFDVRPAKLLFDWYRWNVNGVLIQEAFPYLNASEREFLISGINEAEWNELFKETE